jgi:hypothetical protein
VVGRLGGLDQLNDAGLELLAEGATRSPLPLLEVDLLGRAPSPFVQCPQKRGDPKRGVTYARFLTRAAAFFATHGITRIEAVMSDDESEFARRASPIVRGSEPGAGDP